MADGTSGEPRPGVDPAFIELAIELAGLDRASADGEDAAARAASSVIEEAAKIHSAVEQ